MSGSDIDNITVFITLLVSLLLVLYLYYKYKHSYWKRRNIPQLEPSVPFGNISDFVLRKKTVPSVFKHMYFETVKNGHDYIGVYMFARKALLICNPLLIKQILTTDFHHFHDRDFYFDEVNDPLTASLIAITGQKWKQIRGKLTPAFTSGKLKAMFHIVSNCANELKQIVHENSNIEIRDVLARFTTDVIGSCAFGIDCNSLKDPKTKFRIYSEQVATQGLKDLLKMVLYRNFPQLARVIKMKVINSEISKFFIDVVSQTVEHREQNNINRNDFMQLLIQLKNKGTLENDSKLSTDFRLNINEIAAHAFIFFEAGYETSSAVTSFAFYEIALDQSIQIKLRQEINTIIAKHDGNITYDSIMEMEYLDQVILETMRKYPVVPLLLRKCTKNYKLPNSESIIEEGTPIFISTWGLHSDSKYFPAPEKFLPERFSKENSNKQQEFTYLPFGEGPRVCIGMRFAMMQIKIALTHLLINFKFKLNPKTLVPLKFDKRRQVVLQPLGGIWLDVTKIEN